MSRKDVDNKHIQAFADRAVNLKREHASEYRAQVNRLRDKLAAFLKEHPDFELKKMLLSGSVSKHTALKTINDADVAVYVISAPADVGDLTSWLAQKLRRAFPNFSDEQVVVQNYSVRVEFRGTGLDVDLVPVYQDGEDDWGQLVSQEDGTTLRTNISLHKEFIARRRAENATYAQVVRLLKWWVKTRKDENDGFRFKSFMVELLLAKLYDDGAFSNGGDYPETMLEFFDYITTSNLEDVVYFTDYTGKPASTGDPVRIFDPVNSDNNVARKYTEADRRNIVETAADAGDAIESALRAKNKEMTLRYWRRVFGASFSV